MATRSKKLLDISIVAVLIGLLTTPSARSVTLTGGRLVEDFSTDTYADYSASTGLWDTVNNRARAGVVAGGIASQSISFGDGSDGTLDTAGSVTLNTDAKPNGYNYRSVHLRTGAVVTVIGSNALIIRSLTTFTIDAGVNFNLRGGNGTSGTDSVTAGTAVLDALSGGSPITCSASGGSGGGTTAASGADGTNGKQSDGTDEAATLGTGDSAGAGGDASDAVLGGGPRPDAANFFTTGFVCGSGGGGGGGDFDAGPLTASGGSGGAGGGRLRITSVGTLTIGSIINADGGDGGAGGETGTACGGNGGPGDGGAVWLQSLGLLDIGAAVLPSVNAGADITNACHPLGVGGNAGALRADYTGADPDLAATASTSDAAPNQSYQVVSKAYDLGTLNAAFDRASVSSSAPGGGSVTVEYAGSVDGGSFSAYTSDIASLSNKNYRYLKFKITINTAGVAAASPSVSQIAVDFKDAGLEKLDLKLSPGCGTIADSSSNGSGPPGAGAMSLAAWALFWLLAYRLMRYGLVLKVRRL